MAMARAFSSFRASVLAHVKLQAVPAWSFATERGFAADAGGSFLDKQQVAERVLGVVKNFQKVDPAKVRLLSANERNERKEVLERRSWRDRPRTSNGPASNHELPSVVHRCKCALPIGRLQQRACLRTKRDSMSEEGGNNVKDRRSDERVEGWSDSCSFQPTVRWRCRRNPTSTTRRLDNLASRWMAPDGRNWRRMMC